MEKFMIIEYLCTGEKNCTYDGYATYEEALSDLLYFGTVDHKKNNRFYYTIESYNE